MSVPVRLVIFDPHDGRIVQTFPIAADRVTIGRGHDADIAVLDPGVSRLHAAIVRTEAGYALTELQTLNGVWIEGRRVANAALVDGQQFRLGTTWFRIRMDPRAAATMFIPPPVAPPAAPPAGIPPHEPRASPTARDHRRDDTAPVAILDDDPGPPRRRRRRGLVAAAVVAVLGLAAGGTWLAWRARSTGDVRAQRATPYDPYAKLAAIECPSGTCSAVDLAIGGRLSPAQVPGLEQVELVVPARTRAVSESLQIQIQAAPPVDPATLPVPGASGLRIAGAAVRLEPSGARFDRPMLIRLPYDPRVAPVTLTAVLVSDGPDGTPVVERHEVYVDRAAGVVELEVPHFTVAQVISDLGRTAWGWTVETAQTGVDKANSVWGYTRDSVRAFRRDPPPRDQNFISERCRRARLILDGGPGMPRAVSSETEFWKALNFNVPGHRAHALADYLIKEDGVIEPLRTYREVDLFRRIKEWVKASRPDQKLTTEDVLAMALRSVAVGGEANIQLAMLTAHNVIRILGRPAQWISSMPEDYGHPRSDPATAIFDDLTGKHGAYGEPTLAEILRAQNRIGPTSSQWSIDLFSVDKPAGIFEVLPGTTDTSNNAGSHYYNWVGELTTMVIGPGAAGLGIEREMSTKAEQGIGEIGVIQGANAYRGVDLATCIEGHLTKQDADLVEKEHAVTVAAQHEFATKDEPCPRTKKAFTKCPWSPDGYEIKECDPGFCYDAGFNHTLACKQIQTPAFAYRNDLDNLICPAGFQMVRERCSGIAVGCQPVAPPR